MKVTRRSRLQVRIQTIVFVVLFLAAIGLLAWLSTRYSFVADWTQSGRNTLSEASTALLDTIEGPVGITAFVRDTPESDVMRKRITDIVSRYQRRKPDISLAFVNPDLEPQLVRSLNVTLEGEMVVRFGQRSENLQNLTEQSLTNVLHRVARGKDRWVVFLGGHGERSPRGRANHDIGDFANQLESKGLKILSVNLGSNPAIPDNTAVLVIAGPQVDLLPGEVSIITRYVDDGGNLLWLADPGSLHGLRPLAERLGIEFVPGMIVDPTTGLFGIRDPRFAMVADYASHAITQSFNLLTLFPQASAMDVEAPEGWQMSPFLVSSTQSWSETGELSGEIGLDEGEDIQGPLTIGVAMWRELSEFDAVSDTAEASSPDSDDGEQRIVVIGDGDFVSNTYLGNSGNLDLGLNIINWLSRDDTFIAIPAKTAGDIDLELSGITFLVVGLVLPFVVPLVLVAAGIVIWLRRRKR